MLRETGLGEFIKSIDNLVTGFNVEYRRFGKCDLNVNGEKEVKVQDVKGMPVYETSFEVAGDRGKVYKFVVYVPEEGEEIIRIKVRLLFISECEYRELTQLAQLYRTVEKQSTTT